MGLLILRGNSGSGKTSIAHALQSQCDAPIAVVSQDVIRRTILKEKDVLGAFNIQLIETVAMSILDEGYHVIVEGILTKEHYSSMLIRLASQTDNAHVCYFDVSFDETLHRHQTKPNADEFGEEEMRQWWKEDDVLGVEGEVRISEDLEFAETVTMLRSLTGW